MKIEEGVTMYLHPHPMHPLPKEEEEFGITIFKPLNFKEKVPTVIQFEIRHQNHIYNSDTEEPHYPNVIHIEVKGVHAQQTVA